MDPVLASATQPTVGIKVLDRRHNAIYLWSLDRLQQQLQRMRNLTTFIDRPSYSQHFSSEEPFYNSPVPDHSFIGNALISLNPLSRRLSSTTTAPIFCRYTAEAIGSCRIDLRVANIAPPPKSPKSANGSVSSTRAASPTTATIPPGSKVSFQLVVDQLKGLSSHDFDAVHAQVRLSSFLGPSITAEEVYASSVLDLEKSVLSDFRFSRKFSIVVSSKISAHMKDGYAPIEFFASPKPMYLERLERWDELREQRTIVIPPPDKPEPSPATLPHMRRSENDFVVEQVHDILAWLQVCELAPDGSYAPVPVVAQGHLDPGSFSLHQGLQRRVVITLTSNSGKQLPWSDVTRIRIGNIRLLDPKGRVHESASKEFHDLTLIKQQALEFKPDGTSSLSAEALWDSSVHESTLLNRVTAANQRLLIQVTWLVAVETCLDPVQFSMDMGVTMQTRDARAPSRLLSFLGSAKILAKTSTVFTVRLSPPLTRDPKELWRLDTSEKYVRGEETLSTWKPRGISVVEDHSRLVSTERRAADVQAIRTILAITPPRPPQADAAVWGSDILLMKTLQLWKRRAGHPGDVSAA